MKIAVMSDIHGFAPALDVVLDDIDQRGVDQLIVAGDLVEGGPEPARVLQVLRESGARAVYGNTDRDVLGGDPAVSDLIGWTRDQIGEEGLAYLGSLPFSIRVPHKYGDGDPCTDLLVVHANPTDVDRHLSPNASDREVREILGTEPARTIAFGHLHVAYVREIDGTTLIDVSAVGNPRDGDLRPRYVVFSDDEQGKWAREYHYVDYPLERTHALMEASGMPGWKKAFRRLESASYNRQP
jgi:predicted phosphodiesterase